ncbi:hypothetical protein QFZ74_005754 [Streptomyces sp. V3I7]|nr:hypothetical protein [Streptomyces sp. V3I7]
MAVVASEGAAIRRTRAERAACALKRLIGEPPAPERSRRVLEQALVLARASFAGLYTAGDERLRLTKSAGLPRTLYGLRDGYAASGRSAPAEAHRTAKPVWHGPEELASCPDAWRTPLPDFFVAALPVRTGNGCLVAVSEEPGGFDPEDRACLALIADALTPPAPAPARAADLGELPADAFSLAMDTGRVAVGAGILGLFGIGRAAFDGDVETLLRLTVPEDLPALMSVVEPDHTSLGERELEFRVLQPSGAPKWLRLRGRLLPGDEGAPARLVGTVADAATLRSDVTDVARVQRLAAPPSPPRAPSRTSATPSSPPCAGRSGPTGSRWPSWKGTGSSSPSSTRPNPRPGPRCGAPSGAPNGPTPPCAPCPPSPPP